MKLTKKHHDALAVAAACAASLFFLSSNGFADGVVTLSGTIPFGTLASTDGDGNDAVYTIPAAVLVLAPGASITCNDAGRSPAGGCPIHIVVGGDLLMRSGSSILAENNAGVGAGGAITLEVSGNLILESGSVVSSRKNAGMDKASAGDIFIRAGGVSLGSGGPSCPGSLAGDITIAAGALVTADGPGEAGAISMYAGRAISVEGTVRARGLTTTGHGGPITIASCGGLSTSASSAVSSRGGGPGADLVRLEGSSIAVAGLVESTGPGQQSAGSRNLCSEPGRPANSTACVEIASASTISIAQTAEINADTGFSGAAKGSGWIDLLSPGNISIAGDSLAPYALHSNQGSTNGRGGVIRVNASGGGGVSLAGKAIQANSTAVGGKGGLVTIEATLSSVDLGTASVQAEGALAGGGGNQSGGHILVNALLGDIDGASPGELNARGGVPSNGSVTLNFCHAMNYTGESIPAAVPNQTCAPSNLPR